MSKACRERDLSPQGRAASEHAAASFEKSGDGGGVEEVLVEELRAIAEVAKFVGGVCGGPDTSSVQHYQVA